MKHINVWMSRVKSVFEIREFFDEFSRILTWRYSVFTSGAQVPYETRELTFNPPNDLQGNMSEEMSDAICRVTNLVTSESKKIDFFYNELYTRDECVELRTLASKKSHRVPLFILCQDNKSDE